MICKNHPRSVDIPGLGMSSEKEKEGTYRKVLPQLDILALRANMVVFHITQNSDSGVGCFDPFLHEKFPWNKLIFGYISEAMKCWYILARPPFTQLPSFSH